LADNPNWKEQILMIKLLLILETIHNLKVDGSSFGHLHLPASFCVGLSHNLHIFKCKLGDPPHFWLFWAPLWPRSSYLYHICFCKNNKRMIIIPHPLAEIRR
jgi:hypothetical protein